MRTESRSGYLSAPALRALALIVAITSFATPASAQRAAGGGAHTLLVGSDGSVWSSGHNMFGQLGDDTTESKTLPIQVPGLSNVVAVAAGEAHSLALTSSGSVYAWGYNLTGQLGDGSVTTRRVRNSIPMDNELSTRG